jgi:dTDP-4-dehydrorhamnose reductase
MTCLVLGRSGQLASHLRERMPDALFWGRGELDLLDAASIEPRIAALRPTCLVNAAAYTAVDRAESEPEAAWAINTTAVAALASAAKALDIPLIHVSTDYVFNGQKLGPYVETDTTQPISAYGRTKLGGELAVMSLCPKHWILRTSWVFSEHGANFVKTMLRLGGERDALNVVADQRGVPTYAEDLARVIEALAQHGEQLGILPGVYHAVGGPETSWCDFARQIFARALARGTLAKPVQVNAIPTSAYPTPARRPANSVLAPSQAMLATLGTAMDWPAGLDRMLERLMSNGNRSL